MGGVSLGQDEVLEVNDAHGLGPEPAVRHHLDVVLRGQRLKDGDGEHDVLRLSCYHLEGHTHTLINTQGHTSHILSSCQLRSVKVEKQTCFFCRRKCSEW